MVFVIKLSEGESPNTLHLIFLIALTKKTASQYWLFLNLAHLISAYTNFVLINWSFSVNGYRGNRIQASSQSKKKGRLNLSKTK